MEPVIIVNNCTQMISLIIDDSSLACFELLKAEIYRSEEVIYTRINFKVLFFSLLYNMLLITSFIFLGKKYGR